jgi:hypothetical protein
MCFRPIDARNVCLVSTAKKRKANKSGEFAHWKASLLLGTIWTSVVKLHPDLAQTVIPLFPPFVGFLKIQNGKWQRTLPFLANAPVAQGECAAFLRGTRRLNRSRSSAFVQPNEQKRKDCSLPLSSESLESDASRELEGSDSGDAGNLFVIIIGLDGSGGGILVIRIPDAPRIQAGAYILVAKQVEDIGEN